MPTHLPCLAGDPKDFEKQYAKPILKARDLDATDREIEVGTRASQAFFKRIKPVMLRRTNEVIAKVCALVAPLIRAWLTSRA